MEKFNNTTLFTGYLKQVLTTFNLPKYKVYTEAQQKMRNDKANELKQKTINKLRPKIYDEISDMIMDSWNKRNNSYDIISQKQSDATLGYERVYDTETNEIYKAYNGFTDDYSGNRYKPITDDMYTSAVSGYIEK